MTEVIVFIDAVRHGLGFKHGKFRARAKVCPAMFEGIKRCGERVSMLTPDEYTGKPMSQVAVFYGIRGKLKQIMEDYRNAGLQGVYIDLAYWRRRWRGDRYGFHRFSINHRHPNSYFQQCKHRSDRFNILSIRMGEPKRAKKRGDHILLCGMSEKCAEWEGFQFEEWERSAVERIKAVTDRPIIYRPKPNRFHKYQGLPGTLFRPALGLDLEITNSLRQSWAVVSHHSNAGVDAVIYGIPTFCEEGVPLAVGSSDFTTIENPYFPDDKERHQWASDVAYCQFNRVEMADGTAWRHFKEEGLVP